MSKSPGRSSSNKQASKLLAQRTRLNSSFFDVLSCFPTNVTYFKTPMHIYLITISEIPYLPEKAHGRLFKMTAKRSRAYWKADA